MRCVTVCKCCGGHVDYKGDGNWYCEKCGDYVDTIDRYVQSPFERTRAAVYATGNRWAIENFNATHY